MERVRQGSGSGLAARLTGAGGVYDGDPAEPGGHDNYGGAALVADLAESAGLRSGHVVVDIGAGVGGPALWLTANLACFVVAVELLPSRCRALAAAAEATGSAGPAGLAVVAGDGTRLPLRPGAADVMVSIDGFLHIEDKPGLLASCRSALRPGGTLAFTDWVAEPALTHEDRALMVDSFGASGLGTVAGYVRLLEHHGFDVRQVADLSLMWLLGVQAAAARLASGREALEARYGAELCGRWAARYDLLQRLGAAGALGHVRIIATLRPDPDRIPPAGTGWEAGPGSG